jgi:hypothetical protein
MTPKISSDTFDAFFAWAPWVVGIAIYLAFYLAKRNEGKTTSAQAPATQTFACSECGQRGPREAMVAQDHGGATSWQCASCASQKALA